MKSLSWIFAFALGAELLQPLASRAVLLGQTDTFEDGTTQNWVVSLLGLPSPVPPVNNPSGGPAGADDGFLSLTSIAVNLAGSRMTVINFQNQWAGNYVAAGVTGIAMDVNNLGSSILELRLLFEDATPFTPAANTAFSTNPIEVPAGSGWRHVVFPIEPADLQARTGSVLGALTGATTLRIFHSTNARFPGERIVASLGVDNITAVPEPQVWLVLATTLCMLAAARAVAFRSRRTR
jgi:hypothetical protein